MVIADAYSFMCFASLCTPGTLFTGALFNLVNTLEGVEAGQFKMFITDCTLLYLHVYMLKHFIRSCYWVF